MDHPEAQFDAAVGALAGPLLRQGFLLSAVNHGEPGRCFAALGHWAAVVRLPGDGAITLEDIQCDSVAAGEAERILRALATVATVGFDLRPTIRFSDEADEYDVARRAFWDDMAAKGLAPAGALREERHEDGLASLVGDALAP